MKEFQYTVKDACGIHARPAGLLVKVVKGFSSTATLEKNGKTCDLRKLMALMGVGLFFISYPVGGVVYLGIAFLLSPFGLQAVAGAVITGLNSLNLSLRQFITS